MNSLCGFFPMVPNPRPMASFSRGAMELLEDSRCFSFSNSSELDSGTMCPALAAFARSSGLS